MMMAHDSTPTPPRLDPETLAELRHALSRYVTQGDSDGDLTPALKRLSLEARQKSLRAEQLLIVLKEVWGELPEVRSSSRHGMPDDLLPRVVAMCIDQYYGR